MKKSFLPTAGTPRKNCRDIWWHAFMVRGAKFCKHDIPFCPTTAKAVPKKIITFSEAKEIYKNELRKSNKDFFVDAFVCTYEDDQNFDGKNGIWFSWKVNIRILKHLRGIITPDFSTYRDFPFPLRIWNTYRMRAFGYFALQQGLEVINNVRWNTEESWAWSFAGIPKHSVVCVGTVASGLKRVAHRPYFENGIREMVRVLKPKTILVYGSARYLIFDEIRELGIDIIAYPSATASYFANKKKEAQNEQGL